MKNNAFLWFCPALLWLIILRHRKLIYTHVRNYIISWNFILLPALTGAGTATTSSSSSSPHGSPELISKKE
ncbi:hypothetical protein T4A_8535 [Trichinella pseudospiralis]|uniref:Uncharacterized protein n=1 Tax=Trichinella pseudospiralis TaxID=6337 RepID=A0A0V1EPZ9_TRIPS|nr:hypothetical protein T4A_8535 [Trichinella pseudospiralis]